MSIGENIKRIRKEKNMTLQQLADIMGCSPQLISQYENGKRTPKIKTQIKIATALNVPTSELMMQPGQPTLMDIFGETLEACPVFVEKTPTEVSEDKPVSFPGLEKKVTEIGYSIVYGTYENSDGGNLIPGEVFIQYPDGEKLYIDYSDLSTLNDETDTYLKFRLEELRKRKQK